MPQVVEADWEYGAGEFQAEAIRAVLGLLLEGRGAVRPNGAATLVLMNYLLKALDWVVHRGPIFPAVVRRARALVSEQPGEVNLSSSWAELPQQAGEALLSLDLLGLAELEEVGEQRLELIRAAIGLNREAFARGLSAERCSGWQSSEAGGKLLSARRGAGK